MDEKIFPTDYTDEEIGAEMRRLLKTVKATSYDINTVLQISPIISLAQNELQKRINLNSATQLDKLTRITDQNAETSLQSTRSANKLSKIAIVIALIALIVQVVFSIVAVYNS